jgi:hypothetical protein
MSKRTREPRIVRKVRPGHLFRKSDGLAAGLTESELRGPRFRAVFHGVYLSADVTLSPALRAKAALCPFPDSAWASHASAARIRGVPIPTLPDEHVTVLRAEDRRRRTGIICHLRDGGRIVVVDGVRASSGPQLFVGPAELLGLVDLVIVGDFLVRFRKVKPATLLAFCADSTLPGADHARRAAAYVRERVDSPMARLRMLLVLAGLPEPRVNISVTDAHGLPIRKYDLSYPSVKVAVEYDGRHHVEREEQWESDLDRREASDDDEWRILVITSKGIFDNPQRTLDRVTRLLRRRGLAGVPRRLSDDWRAHFPGRE